jgi:16S rRNA (uracil1498-N3)-methyltransferase
MGIGERIFVTDGRGKLMRCRIEEQAARSTRAEIIDYEPVIVARNPVTLALACIKKERFERAVEQCTELGVTRFVPFVSEKCHLTSYKNTFIERLKRISQAAMIQSFQSILPDMYEVIPFGGLSHLIKEVDHVVVGDAAAPPLDVPDAGQSILLIIGPEGGFTQDEREQLGNCGCIYASSARSRLRSETAAMALASVVLSVSD